MTTTLIRAALTAVAAGLVVAAPVHADPPYPSPEMIDNAQWLCAIIESAVTPEGGAAQAILAMSERSFPADEAAGTMQLAVNDYCPQHRAAVTRLYVSTLGPNAAPEAKAEVLVPGQGIPGYPWR